MTLGLVVQINEYLDKQFLESSNENVNIYSIPIFFFFFLKTCQRSFYIVCSQQNQTVYMVKIFSIYLMTLNLARLMMLRSAGS